MPISCIPGYRTSRFPTISSRLQSAILPSAGESLFFRHNPSVNGKSIHNQFFLASLDALADDGLMAMVVSHNLMDALDPGGAARHGGAGAFYRRRASPRYRI